MRQNNSGSPVDFGFKELLEAGVPKELLARPNTFYKTGSGTKIHADSHCSHLSKGPWNGSKSTQSVLVNLLTAKSSRFCSRCVGAPTNTVTRNTWDIAKQVVSSQKVIDRLVALAATDAALENSKRLSEVAFQRRNLNALPSSPKVHEDLVEWLMTRINELTTTLDELDVAFNKSLGDNFASRWALLDGLCHEVEEKSSSLYARSASDPSEEQPVIDYSAFPALCNSGYSRSMSKQGQGSSMKVAWATWRDLVAKETPFEAAHSEALNVGMAALDADLASDPKPDNVAQLPSGPPLVPMPESGDLKEWMFLSWRRACELELSEFLNLVRDIFLAREVEASSSLDEVVLLTGNILETLPSRKEAALMFDSVELVSGLDSADKPLHLAILPHAVVTWLSNHPLAKSGYYGTSVHVEVLSPVLDGDSSKVLSLALELYRDKVATSVKDALSTARDVHTNQS